MLISEDPERLCIKEDLSKDTIIFLGRGVRIDFTDGLWSGGVGNEGSGGMVV